MANVVINLDVSDELLEEIYSKEIEKLSDDVLQEILTGAMRECMGPGLFYVESKKDYWSSPVEYKPTELTNKIIRKIDYEKYLNPIVEEISEFIRNNFKEIIEEYALKTFANLLFTPENKSDLVSDVARMFESYQSNRS